jgi:hypothetical protein
MADVAVDVTRSHILCFSPFDMRFRQGHGEKHRVLSFKSWLRAKAVVDNPMLFTQGGIETNDIHQGGP